MKKCIYTILTIITVIGAIIIGIKGFNVDVTYSKNTRIDIYIGKEFNNSDIKQIAQEVFENTRIKVQKIEYYEDIVAITIKQEDAENIDEKLELLNTKINEKYELEGKVEDITITNYPKATLSSVLNPYIMPISISIILIVIFALIRYRKLNFIKVLLEYVFNIVLTEGAFIGIIAITRIPLNNIIIAITLLIYAVVITTTTIQKEKEIYNLKISFDEK